MTPPWVNPQQWKPLEPPMRGDSSRRSPQALLEITRQFHVAEALRYRPSPGITWCNIYLWDATKALGCEIPHFYSGKELTANATCDWLVVNGPLFGWYGVTDAVTAQAHASAGLPVVATWKNPKGHGHVAVCVPTPAGFSGVYVTQAGGTNFEEGPIARGFGKVPVTYFGHL